MDAGVRLEVRATDVAVERDGALAPWIRMDLRRVRHVLEAVDEHVRVLILPAERPELDARDEERKVMHLHLGVAPVDEAGEVEQLRAVVNLLPEARLQPLLRLPQPLPVAEVVEVRQDAEDLREAVHLQNVQELEGFHLEAEGAVDHQQHEIGHLRQIHHRVDVVRHLEQRDPPLLACYHRNGPGRVRQGLPRVVLDERFDERRLAAAGRSHNNDHNRRRQRCGAVDHASRLLAMRAV